MSDKFSCITSIQQKLTQVQIELTQFYDQGGQNAIYKGKMISDDK